MPLTHIHGFEVFRSKLLAARKPLPERELAPVHAQIVKYLDTIPEMLVQKSKRPGHPESLIEITGTWVGLDPSPRTIIQTMRESWPGPLFDGIEEMHHIRDTDDGVVVIFAAAYGDDRYLTGRLLLPF